MKPRHEAALAGLAIGVALLAWFVTDLLLFYVPHLLSYADDGAIALSLFDKLLLAQGRFAHAYVEPSLPALLAATVAAFWWRVHAVRKARAR